MRRIFDTEITLDFNGSSRVLTATGVELSDKPISISNPYLSIRGNQLDIILPPSMGSDFKSFATVDDYFDWEHCYKVLQLWNTCCILIEDSENNTSRILAPTMGPDGIVEYELWDHKSLTYNGNSIVLARNFDEVKDLPCFNPHKKVDSPMYATLYINDVAIYYTTLNVPYGMRGNTLYNTITYILAEMVDGLAMLNVRKMLKPEEVLIRKDGEWLGAKPQYDGCVELHYLSRSQDYLNRSVPMQPYIEVNDGKSYACIFTEHGWFRELLRAESLWDRIYDFASFAEEFGDPKYARVLGCDDRLGIKTTRTGDALLKL